MSEQKAEKEAGSRSFSRPVDDAADIETNVTVVPHDPSVDDDAKPSSTDSKGDDATAKTAKDDAKADSKADDSSVKTGEKVTLASRLGRAKATVVEARRTSSTPTADGSTDAKVVAERENKTAVDTKGERERRPGGVRATRKARLRISRLDPWSVMKTSLLFSVAFSIMTFVAVWVLWAIIDASGALESLQNAIVALIGNADGSSSFEITRYVDQWRVLGFTAIVCVINVVLLTALATLMSFLYNLAATILGGLEVTLAED